MLFVSKFLYAVLFLIFIVKISYALKYQFIPEDDEFFGDCSNQPNNVLNIYGVLDTSEFTVSRQDDIIYMSGNATYKWNIQPGDRIEMSFQLFKFDRIAWVQTLFGMTVRNMCAVLYDEPQYWYKYWTKYITNKEDVKDKCMYPGTKIIHEPFSLNLIFDFTGLPLSGRHKVICTIRAFNANNVERETSICIEVEGHFERLN
ncbi:PREDICTED: uncharacterized protein LOC108609598 [Drosophila arizonae]|uniref:Uncharacterized protein LOC108609598 n=1 Tax=Drosophila arizonae TaxID=7263 RepID=A0ABM1NPC0_DROAR|nr:PREDICTED: uncharacterized protein LOC108609598 [Drosophila arizonae]